MDLIEHSEGGTLRVWGRDGMDDNTIDQAARSARLSVVDGVALMPDAHVGMGATVGSVIATEGAVIPTAVGVDIGCGMIAAKTTLYAKDLPPGLNGLHRDLETVIPSGMGKRHSSIHPAATSWFQRHPAPITVEGALFDRALSQFGTLGGGNHFVEVCLDFDDGVWLMLHSGSRGVGKELAEYHIDQAKTVMHLADLELEDPELAYLQENTPEFRSYIRDMLWAQDYAFANRQQMMDNALDALRRQKVPEWSVDFTINCHHNFCQLEEHFGKDVWVTRKGAIQANAGQDGIIPGSMATGTYIVRGLGNSDSYNSCSHGAGRRLSRGQARRTLTPESLTAAMEGKAWNDRSARDLVDEHPEAYKSIESVMEAQSDLVEPVYKLSQILNLKGTDERRSKKRNRR